MYPQHAGVLFVGFTNEKPAVVSAGFRVAFRGRAWATGRILLDRLAKSGYPAIGVLHKGSDLAAKVKRKFRHVYRDPKTGRFVSKTTRRRKRYQVKRSKTPPKRLRKPAKKLARVRKPKRSRVRLIQKRYVKPLDSLEYIYEIPFELRKRQFLPSLSAIESVFKTERHYTDKFSPLAACKVNLTFKDEETGKGEDDESWSTVPIGRRIAVDEPNGEQELYQELIRFLLSYDVFALHQIQLSIIRIPI